MTHNMPWQDLADSVLSGQTLTADQARDILNASDDQLLDQLAAAYRVRREHFDNDVQLYYLKNAKSGLCPEDCGYCSQSKVSDAPIEKYVWLNEEKLLAGAREAAKNQSRTYCIVASGRGPSQREVDHVSRAVKRIKEETGLHICCCLGLLDPDQAEQLADAGVDRINHNLNTSRRHYETVCSTHTYDDRLETLKNVSKAGMELCSGLIVGMGETQDDLIEVVSELQQLNVASVPVNFLNDIDGTPLEESKYLNPRECLRALCLFRFALPTQEIRVAGGREVNLRTLQPLSLYAANSLFVSDYLTTAGQAASEDFKMIEDLGFRVILADGTPAHFESEQEAGVGCSPTGGCGEGCQ